MVLVRLLLVVQAFERAEGLVVGLVVAERYSVLVEVLEPAAVDRTVSAVAMVDRTASVIAMLAHRAMVVAQHMGSELPVVAVA